MALIFDSWLKLWMLSTRPVVLDWIDEIEAEVLSWEGITGTLHQYGGLQFNLGKVEIGHIHSNGIMDVLFSRQFKQELMKEGQIEDHHLFTKSGWISFLISSEEDKNYAKYLLGLSYERELHKAKRGSLVNPFV